MARKFTKRRWRRPERMTLEAPTGLSRRKNLGPPDILTLETDLEQHASRRRTTAMTALFAIIALAEGILVGLLAGMLWLAAVFLALALIYVAFVRSFGGRWIVRAMGAEPAKNPRLNRYGHNLAVATGMPEPQVLIVRADKPNAFAIGLKAPAVVATTGSLNIEDLTLEALIAHEVVHIRDGDASLASTYTALAGPANLMKGNSSASVLLGAVAVLMFPAVAVVRALRGWWFADDYEHRADVAAALLTRYPPGVATALRAAEGASQIGPRVAADFWFAPRNEGRARLIEEM